MKITVSLGLLLLGYRKLMYWKSETQPSEHWVTDASAGVTEWVSAGHELQFAECSRMCWGENTLNVPCIALAYQQAL
jgi:hypothetical protein